MRHDRVRQICSRAVVVFVCATAVRASSNVPIAPAVVNKTVACPGGGHYFITGNWNKDANGKLSGALKYQYSNPTNRFDDCKDENGNVVTGTLYVTMSGPESAPTANIDGSTTTSQPQPDGSYLPVAYCRPFLTWFHGAKTAVGENCGLPFPFTGGDGGGDGNGDGGRECDCACTTGEDCTEGGTAFCQSMGDEFNICGCPIGNGCDGQGNPTFAPSTTSDLDEVGAR